MSHDENEVRRTRVVVETPDARREEIVQQQTTRITPDYEDERRGFSTTTLALVAIAAVALTAMLFMFLTNREDETANANNLNDNLLRATPLVATPQPTPFVTTPPQVVYQPPPPVVEQPPQVIVQQVPVPVPTNGATAPPMTTAPPAAPTAQPFDDTALQQQITGKIATDSQLGESEITVSVLQGRATLVGTVSSAAAKRRAEQLAKATRGINRVDNQLTIANPAEPQ